jgi:hypothetical protein
MLADDEIQGLLDAEIASSIGYSDSELSEARIQNLKAFLGEPYGNEREGYSQVMSTDVMNTVEWIMPSLMRVFTGGDKIATFEPARDAKSPEEFKDGEAYAKQATDYCDFVVMKDNPGFVILQTWFKDALVSKNGIVKSYWDVETKQKQEKYRNLPENGWAALATEIESKKVKLVEYEEFPVPPEVMAASPELAGQMMRNVTVETSREYGCVKIKNVPPEEFLLSRDAVWLEDARFQGHKTKKTLSWLIEQGYPKDVVMDLSGDPSSTLGGSDEESLLRADTTDEAGSSSPHLSLANKAMREVWVIDGYMRVDRDEDGVAEMVHVVAAGTGWKILEVERWDGPTPFDEIKPSLVPHRWSGLCPADMIKDLQLIKTTVFRQYLDALYLANNPREEVEVDRIVDPDEVLNAKPGAKIRVTGPTPAIRPIPTIDISAQALQGMEFIDATIENRVGVTKYNQGLDANSLNKTASGISQIMGAAQQRIELIARCFAETGVKSLFRKILYLSVRHGDKNGRVLPIKGKPVQFNPRLWSEEMEVSISIGSAAGTREMSLQHLMNMAMVQEKIVMLQGGAQGPIVTMKNLYETAVKIAENAGFHNSETFVSDPETTPAPPPKPDPEVEKAKAELQLKQQDQQAQLQMKQAELQMDAQRQQQELAMRQQESAAEMQLEREKAALAIQLEREKAAAQMEIERMKAQNQMSIEREKASHQAEIAAATFAAKEKAGAFKPKPANA